MIIDTIAKLEEVIGKTPPAMHLKVIDHLDGGNPHWHSLVSVRRRASA